MSMNQQTSNMRWILVRTKPRQEVLAHENLERQNFKTYLPKLQLRKRRRVKWIDVIEPLFPGYLFVQVDPNQTSIAPIRSTQGVNGIVRFGNRLVPVPDEVISFLKLNEQQDSGYHLSDIPFFEKGEDVQFVDGPFKGLTGVFQMDKEQDRVMILIKILGRPNSITVKLDDVVKNR